MAATSGSVLYVTYIEKQGAFIKIWGQTDRNLPLIIEKALLQMIPQFDQGHFIPTLENIQTGNVLYCAKYVDGSYYRARIINITLLQQSFVEVHFVDFGNREIVPIMNLRMISSFAPGLLTIPPQAKDFILANVTHQGSTWDPTTLSLISNEIRYSELTYIVVSQVGTSLLIKLFRSNEDFALSLFNRGIVLSIAMNAQHMILQNTAAVGISPLSMPTSIQQAIPPPMVTPRPVHSPTTQPPTPALLTYKGAMIDPGAEYQVYVSYVCDGPCQFSIQLQKYEDNLVRLMKELNSMTLLPLEDFPMPGTVCVARCVEDDHICRAVVTNMVDSKYKVFYVDFGNTEVVPIENLFQIPFKYIIPKVMATRYALAGLDQGNVTIEMKCAFKEFVCDKLLRMQALPAPARSALPLCNLVDENNINVLDVLQGVALLAYPEMLQLSRGFSQEVHVSYVHSCSNFFVQVRGKEEELTNLMQHLQIICASGNNLQTVKVGLPCCALFEDGQWYRAQIINIEGAAVKVRYVDFGNEAVVTIDQLIKPPGEVITVLRPQAVECCLNGYQNMEDDLERDNILEQIILEKDFTMKVIEMQNNRALVDLIDASRYNVGSLLLEQLAAARSQVSPLLIQENHQIEQRKKRSIDESTSMNRNDRKPLRDQNERPFDRQDSWRQSKPRSEFDGDKPPRDNVEKSWRDTNDRPQTDSFDKPRRDNFEKKWEGNPDKSNTNSFDKPRRDNFEKRDGFKKDNWQGDDSNSNFKSNHRDGFKKEYREGDGDSSWKSKPKDDGGWDNSESNQRQNNRPNKFNDDYKKPRDFNRFDKKDSWGSSDTAQVTTVNTVTDPAPFTATFKFTDLLNRNEKITISWFHDPAHFFCQLYDQQADIKTMMEDIQNHYCNIKPVSAPVGAPVIALFKDDGVMYRARILEVTGSQYRVQFVDFGNVSNSDKVWQIENKFMTLASQAICCNLNGLTPIGDTWPSSESFSSHFDKEYYYCQFVSCENNSYAVSLTADGINAVSDNLIEAGLAQYIAEREVYDPNILLGQQIKVILRDVTALNAFNIELPNGVWLVCSMHNLTTASETYENVLKEFTENWVLIYVDNVLEDKIEVTLYDTTGTKLKIIEPDEGAFDTVVIPCPLPILYSSVTGWVIHVETNNDAANVFIQPAEYADSVAELLDNLCSHYEAAPAEEPVQPEIDGFYAVHSADMNWYRAQVTNIEDSSAVVRFIDYGNTETVDLTALRTLSAEFFEQHILALQVSASGADESYIEQNVSATVWYGENGWEAEIQIQPAEQEEIIEKPNVIQSVNTEVSTIEAAPADAHLQEEVLASQTEVETINDIGVPVILSHVDSPNEFYLQQSDSLETIDNLQATLQEQVVDFPNLENPAVGVLCAAPYSLDQQWYRAQVLDADDDITTVRFVDYGNTDVITNETTNVKTLPSELLSLEQYARRSSLMLSAIGSEWSSAASERFEVLTSAEHLRAEIIHQDDKTTFVQLYGNGVDVAEVMIQEGLASKLQLEIESSCTGYVSNLNSPTEFWIQLENSVADLEWVAEQLSSANNFPELEDLTPGSLCAALFPDDEMWYRARILSNTVAGLEVLFVDYGNSCTCISLRQLPEDLIMLSPLAQKCSLQKPTGILQWGQQADDEFKTISADGATVFNIDKVSTGETYIVRLILNGEDISSKLLPLTEGGYISHFESPSSFWIQKEQDVPKLDLISEKLTEAHDWPKYEQNEDCELVAALQLEDETWYRARIISKNECDYEVFFIDYGNTGKTSDIHLLNCDIDKEYPLAINSKLEPMPGCSWGEEASTQLAEINNEGSTLFQVEFLAGGVVQLYLNGIDIRSNLESIAVSSVPSSPKKVIPVNASSQSSIQNEVNGVIESTCIPEEDKEINIINDSTEDPVEENLNECIQVAEFIITELEDSVNKEIDSKITGDVTFNEIVIPEVSNEIVDIPADILHTDIPEKIVTDILHTISEAVLENEKVDDGVENYKDGEDLNTHLNCGVENISNNITNESEILQLNENQISNNVDTSEDKILDTLTFNRRSSIPYSEKVLPGYVTYHEHYNHNHESQDLVDHDNHEFEQNCSQTQPLNVHTEEYTDNHNQTSVLVGTGSLVDICTKFILPSKSASHTPVRRLSIPHAEKIVPGCISYKYITHDTYQSDDETPPDLQNNLTDTLSEHVKSEFIEYKREINICDKSDYEPPLRRLSIPHEEKIVPGCILHNCIQDSGHDNLESYDVQLHLQNENHTLATGAYSNSIKSITEVQKIVVKSDLQIPLNRLSIPHSEKILPGCISQEYTEDDEQDTVKSYKTSNNEIEAQLKNKNGGPDMLNKHLESQIIEDIAEVKNVNDKTDLQIPLNRLSIPHSEKILPGCISHEYTDDDEDDTVKSNESSNNEIEAQLQNKNGGPDLLKTHIESQIEDITQVENVDDKSDFQIPIRNSSMLHAEPASPSSLSPDYLKDDDSDNWESYESDDEVGAELENECNRTNISQITNLRNSGANSSKDQYSLPHAEKIVPGSICRGDLSAVVDEESTAEEKKVSAQESKKELKEQILIEYSELVEKSSEADLSTLNKA